MPPTYATASSHSKYQSLEQHLFNVIKKNSKQINNIYKHSEHHKEPTLCFKFGLKLNYNSTEILLIK